MLNNLLDTGATRLNKRGAARRRRGNFTAKCLKKRCGNNSLMFIVDVGCGTPPYNPLSLDCNDGATLIDTKEDVSHCGVPHQQLVQLAQIFVRWIRCDNDGAAAVPKFGRRGAEARGRRQNNSVFPLYAFFRHAKDVCFQIRYTPADKNWSLSYT